jgi:hypothetical protein
VAHACNPSYSGGRDQEDHGLKSAQANSSPDPFSKIPNTKRTGGVAQGEGPEVKPQFKKKKKKERKKEKKNKKAQLPKRQEECREYFLGSWRKTFLATGMEL